jgi:hypothetical protein
MKSILALASLCLLLSLNSLAQTCPLGPKDEHLNIHRIMINYGKFVGQADHIALLGARYPNETVTDADITDVIDRLGSAIACAQAILDNPTGDMLPDKASFISGQELKDYIDDFLYFTTEFRDALVHYRTSFVAISQVAAAQRNWEDLYQESQELNDLIDRAHRKTAVISTNASGNIPGNAYVRLTSANAFVEVMPPAGASLKANMKEANERLKTIADSVTDASQSAVNAALAGEMAQLFAICKTQIPDDLKQVPEPQKQKALQEFQSMIQQAVDLSTRLQQLLSANDLTGAQSVIKQIKQLKNDGHDKFDP